MKVLDITNNNNARVVVLGNGHKLHEYEVENHNGEVQCLIPAETDQNVAVLWNVNADFEHYQVDLFIDGLLRDTEVGARKGTTKAGAQELIGDLFEFAHAPAKGKGLSKFEMFFQDLTGSKPFNPKMRSSIGTIEVKICLAKANGASHAAPATDLELHELGLYEAYTSTDPKDPTHGIGFRVAGKLQATAVRKKEALHGNRPGLAPWATFKFVYRSKAAITSAGIPLRATLEDYIVRFRSRPLGSGSAALGAPGPSKSFSPTLTSKARAQQLPSRNSDEGEQDLRGSTSQDAVMNEPDTNEQDKNERETSEQNAIEPEVNDPSPNEPGPNEPELDEGAIDVNSEGGHGEIMQNDIYDEDGMEVTAEEDHDETMLDDVHREAPTGRVERITIRIVEGDMIKLEESQAPENQPEGPVAGQDGIPTLPDGDPGTDITANSEDYVSIFSSPNKIGPTLRQWRNANNLGFSKQMQSPASFGSQSSSVSLPIRGGGPNSPNCSLFISNQASQNIDSTENVVSLNAVTSRSDDPGQCGNTVSSIAKSSTIATNRLSTGTPTEYGHNSNNMGTLVGQAHASALETRKRTLEQSLESGRQSLADTRRKLDTLREMSEEPDVKRHKKAVSRLEMELLKNKQLESEALGKYEDLLIAKNQAALASIEQINKRCEALEAGTPESSSGSDAVGS